MDSVTSVPTLTDRPVRVLHLESTNVCQARCELCARHTNSNFDPNQVHHLDMSKIIKIFGIDKIQYLNKMFMCGNYGDPAAGQHTVNIYQEFRRYNPDIVLGMNTNGGLQSSHWWQQLAQLFNQPRDYVVFSIDGLEDTNSIYRRGVDWSKLMINVQAFIRAGGSAHWDMLVYKHNQHQVEQCEQIARDLGFRWFRAKVSKRGITATLEMPQGWQKPSTVNGAIQCQAMKEQSLYINAQGQIAPCCWLDQDSTPWDQIERSWHQSNPHSICQKTCSLQPQGTTQFENQWQRQIELQSRI